MLERELGEKLHFKGGGNLKKIAGFASPYLKGAKRG
jgi:hypothetical protein